MSEGEARPVYFPSGDQTLFGWLDGVQVGSADCGIIVCGPFGYEAICAHLSMRAFASTCAEAGFPTLRFDYSGTGDSSDGGDPDQILRWRNDVCAAIDFLRQATGVTRVCLLGFRLGALLAALAAEHREIDGLIAVAPVTSGRRYLRELRAFQAGATTQSRSPSDAQDGSTGDSAGVGDGALEVTGFSLSKQSIATLERVDVAKSVARPRAALILDRDDLQAAKTWATALESAGTETRYEALPGFNEMVSTPHAATVPTLMLESMGRWLSNYRDRGAAPLVTRRVAQLTNLPTRARIHLDGNTGTPIFEEALFIDGQTLFGIISEPAEPSTEAQTLGCGVLMLNTGATSHIGPNRMYVELARRWAARGYTVLRLDLAGLGDSLTRPGERTNEVYPPGALYDIGVAIEYLRRQRGIRNLTLMGLCAGAYHSLRAAITGLPLNTVLLINPLTFYWKQGSTLSDLQISEVVRNPGVYAEHALSWRHWQKLFRGQVNLWRVAAVLARRVWLTVESSGRDLCRKLHIRTPDDLGWDLRSVTERGIRIAFFFARGDGGLELLKVQAGSTKHLGDKCRIHIFEDADHIFTQREPRVKLMRLLDDELGAALERAERISTPSGRWRAPPSPAEEAASAPVSNQIKRAV